MQVEGYCEKSFENVRATFNGLWSEIEVGAACAVYLEGKLVVNLWGGYQNRDRDKPWQADTLVNTYSITKGVVATAIALLVDQGQLTYDDLVVDHWPEFAQHGKAGISVAELLSHQAGLCGIEQPLSVEDLFDSEKITRLLAAQPLLWQPNGRCGYHAITWGYLAGELIRRITHMSAGQFIDQNLSQPLGLNFYLGVPEEKLDRCAELIGPNHANLSYLGAEEPKKAPKEKLEETPTERSKLIRLAQLNPIIGPFKHASSNAFRRAEIPGSNGHGDALSIARLYGLLANQGSIDGRRFLGSNTISQATDVAVDSGEDLVMGHVIRRSKGGYILSHAGNYGPGQHSFGHAGTGGSVAFADPELGLSFCYVMNQLQPEHHASRSRRLIKSVYDTIDQLTPNK